VIRILLALVLTVAPAAPAAAVAANPSPSIEQPERLAAKGKKPKKKKGAKKAPAETKPEWRPRTDAAIATYNRAVDSFNARDLEASAAGVSDALALEPGFGLAEHLRASVLLQGRNDEAIAALRGLAARFPHREEPWDTLAWALFAAQDFGAARAAAESGLAVRPDSIELQEELQFALVRLGLYDVALAQLAARRGRGDHPDLACLEVLVRVERGEMDEAVALMERCAKGDPGRRAIAQSRIDGESSEADGQRALEALGVAGASTIADAIDAFNADDYPAAIDFLTLALERFPDDPSLLVLRARAAHHDGRTDDALADLEVAVGLGTESRRRTRRISP